MEGLVVGNPDCKIEDIIGTLKQNPVIGQLGAKLFDIAMGMETPYELKDRLRKEITIFGLKTPPDGLENILQDWRSRAKDDAKLLKFIEILEKENLNEFAQALRDKFGASDSNDPPEAATASSTTSRGGVNTSALVVRQKQHILDKMPELIEMTEWNALLMAKMQSKGILQQADLVTLRSLPNPQDRTQQFFEFLHQRLVGKPWVYDKVIESFDELCQDGVSHVLKLVYE